MPERGHHQGGGGHGQGHGHGGGGNGGGKGKGKRSRNLSRQLAGLLDPTSVSSGKDLLRLAKALTKTKILPEKHAYKRLAKELQGQQAADQQGYQRLGEEAGRHIAGAYQGFDAGAQGATANQMAIGGMLNQQTAGNALMATQERNTVAQGQLGGLQEAMTLRGAPGGGAAQDALKNLVAQQAQRGAMESQASGNFAAAQGANYAGLSEGMRGAGALQGAEAQSTLARTIAARQAESRLASSQDIREALGKKGDVAALKGATMLENLSTLRESERDYSLGRAATRVDKRGQDITAATAAAAQAETHRHNVAAEGTAARNAQTSRYSAHHPGSGSGGNRPHDDTARREHRQDQIEHHQDVRAANSAADGLGGKDPAWVRQNFEAFVQQIMENAGLTGGSGRNIAQRAAHRWLNQNS